MSQDTFDMAVKCDINSVPVQLALQCAPVISGLKISNLLIINDKDRHMVRSILAGSEISYFVLLRSNGKTTLLLFNEEKLAQYIRRNRIRKFFEDKGYENEDSIIKLLYHFRLNYEAYIKDNGVFPHEMGLLLGYPIEDVEGFINNSGKNFLYCGYWKVYSEKNKKVELFGRYEKAKSTLLKLIFSGKTIEDVINIYSYKRRMLKFDY